MQENKIKILQKLLCVCVCEREREREGETTFLWWKTMQKKNGRKNIKYIEDDVNMKRQNKRYNNKL